MIGAQVPSRDKGTPLFFTEAGFLPFVFSPGLERRSFSGIESWSSTTSLGRHPHQGWFSSPSPAPFPFCRSPPPPLLTSVVNPAFPRVERLDVASRFFFFLYPSSSSPLLSPPYVLPSFLEQDKIFPYAVCRFRGCPASGPSLLFSVDPFLFVFHSPRVSMMVSFAVRKMRSFSGRSDFRDLLLFEMFSLFRSDSAVRLVQPSEYQVSS